MTRPHGAPAPGGSAKRFKKWTATPMLGQGKLATKKLTAGKATTGVRGKTGPAHGGQRKSLLPPRIDPSELPEVQPRVSRKHNTTRTIRALQEASKSAVHTQHVRNLINAVATKALPTFALIADPDGTDKKRVPDQVRVKKFVPELLRAGVEELIVRVARASNDIARSAHRVTVLPNDVVLATHLLQLDR